ncbi:MAG: co-chaperone GroES [Actinobacteria bacterium]|nr:co-chaperone GroES [Actinomycetota bacterium]
MTKIRPLGDKVLIQRLEAEAKTAGGIVLPDSAKEKPKRGKIVAVGEGKLLEDGKRAKIQVKKGDEVLFSSYAGTDITVGTKEMLIMSEDDILAIIA